MKSFSMRVLVASGITLFGLLQLTTSSATSQAQTPLTTAPSVKLHVRSKRKTMKIHGTTEFDIFATPVLFANGTSVLYNSYATFVNGDSELTYTTVDGAGYLTTKDASNVMTVQCLSPSALPFHQILPALNGVSPIASASIGKDSVECASGNLFKLSYLSVQYVICGSGEAGFTAFSSDFDITVEYLDRPVSIPKPQLTDGSGSCEPIEKATSLTPTAIALITGGEMPSSVSRRLKDFREILNGILPDEYHIGMAPTKCEAEHQRPCIMFHGLGNKRQEDELQDTPEMVKERFGTVWAPFCSSIKYAVLNTVDYGWRHNSLQHKFCNHALSMSDTSNNHTGMIRDTIIVTHSMGGLVMANAIATGKCKLSKKTTSWVAISAPMTGSMGSDFLANYCKGDSFNVAGEVLDIIGECPISNSRQSVFSDDGKYVDSSHYHDYKAAQKAYRKHVAAAMCSDNFVGVLSKFQAEYIAVATILPHHTKQNDGLVEFNSCLGGWDAGKFGNNYMDTFYRPQLNHADTAFTTDDGSFRDSQKQHKWFECLPLGIKPYTTTT